MAKTKGKAEVEKKTERLERLQVEYVQVDEVQPNLYNPNRQSEHEFKMLCKSIEEDGFTQPGVCVRVTEEIKKDKRFAEYELGSIVIVDGEHRWRAARQIGYTEIPVVFAPMTPEQMRVATLRHNRARGSEDAELSAEVLRDLQELGALDWAQDSLDMDDTELNKLLDDMPAPEALAGEEFAEAWHPAKGTNSAEAGDVPAGEGRTASTTAEAADEQRRVEGRIREAKTEEERQSIKADSNVHRIILAFGGEEAKATREVLELMPGPGIADRIVALCRQVIDDSSAPWPEPEVEDVIKLDEPVEEEG